MRDIIFLLFDFLTTLAKLLRPGGGRAVIAENLLLKQQLIIHSRSRQRAPNLSVNDRALPGFWSLFLNPRRIVRSAIIIKPSTLLRFHNALKTRKYRLVYSSFRAEAVTLKTHWIMVVMDQYTRRIIGFGVHAGNVGGPALCRMLSDATSKQEWSGRISTDNDPLFQYHRWKANLRVLDIKEIKSVPHVRMSHPFVERLIGSVRRELLEQTFFWTATDLENKFRHYQHYYNKHRCHLGLDGKTPEDSGSNNTVDINQCCWEKHCRGLFQLPVAA